MGGSQGNMLSAISQRKTNIMSSHLSVESKNVELIETERVVVARSWGWRKWGDVGQRVQASNYKVKKFWQPNKPY